MPMAQDDPQFQWVGNGNWTSGNHNVRFGSDIYYQEINQAQPEMQGSAFGASGGFAFQQAQTRLRGGAAGSEYNAFASFLLGAAARTGRTVLIPSALMTRSWMYSAYVRDRWQATRKLTLSYGLRWEYFPLMRRNDHGVERYDWANNKMLLCGVEGVPMDCGIHESKRLFVPRLGFAYRASETFVIRAGYGITNDPYTYIRALRGNYPVIVASEFNSPDGFSPAALLVNGIPEMPVPDLTKGVIDVNGRVALYSFMENNYKRGYIQSWNLTLQKQFLGSWMAEAGYVATRTIRQASNIDRNAGFPGGGEASRPLNIRFGRTARTSQITGAGTQTYDSLQTKLERRFAAGYQVSAAYTFSKAMGIWGAVNSDGGPAINLPQYYRLNRAPSSIDRTHSFHTTAMAELPFGRGKRWVSSRVGSAILGGWQISTILTFADGTPWGIGSIGDRTHRRAPTPIPMQRRSAPSRTTRPRTNAGTSTRSTPPIRNCCSAYGNTGRNVLRTPGVKTWDASVAKRFSIIEGHSLEFRWEGFNLPNHPNMNAPSNDVTNPAAFGRIV
jgi:hypothetical protein